MRNYYVISDNQYFSIGVASLISGSLCVSLVPDDITMELKKISYGIVLVYIKNRNIFREVCSHLADSECELIFFFDVPAGLREYNVVSSRFWNAKISVMDFSESIPTQIKYFVDNIIDKISVSRMRRVYAVAKGLKYYNQWVSLRAKTRKGRHNHNRSLLNTLGIDNVSVHNLSLAEEIALACVTVRKIQNRQRLAGQHPEGSDKLGRQNVPER